MVEVTNTHQLTLEEVKKNKKTEPKVFPFLLMVDKEAFGKIDEQVYILKTFWKSPLNKIVVARKSDTQSIVGYACFQETKDGKGCYLMRIGVRSRCQRQGIGRKLMTYLFEKYPLHMSLDVSTDNEKAVHFYHKCGLELVEKYVSEEKVEFAKFETPLKNFTPFTALSHPTEEKKSESSSRNQESDEETLISDSEMMVAQPSNSESITMKSTSAGNIPRETAVNTLF
jgi:ribosomal protein S18 acetylase RimI-like enzyme